MGNVRSALRCLIYCTGIFAAVWLLRAGGALSFLPESDAGKAAAVLGEGAMQEWSDELVEVFGTNVIRSAD